MRVALAVSFAVPLLQVAVPLSVTSEMLVPPVRAVIDCDTKLSA